MKTTTCVRVVLPSDELVRVECVPSMTVSELMRKLGKRSACRKNNDVESSGNGDISCIDCDIDPAADRACRTKDDLGGKLTLVRVGSELQPWRFIVDEVKDLDILEFHPSTFNYPRWPAKHSFEHPNKQSSTMALPRRKAVEEIRPVSTVCILSCEEQQNQTRTKLSSPVNEVDSLGFLANNYRRSLIMKKLLQRARHKRRLLSRRRCPGQEIPALPKLNYGCRSSCQNADAVLLRAGMQLIDRIQLLQDDVQGLVLLLRDAVLGNSALSTDKLLRLLKKMVDTLTDSNANSRVIAYRRHSIAPLSGDEMDKNSPGSSNVSKEELVRGLSEDIAGGGGVAILFEGSVVSTQWGSFWRSQKEEYACLCDNHILYFFPCKTRCADFVFELGREREGRSTEASKRFLKDKQPLSQIDLSETDWMVRKSTPQGGEGRHAFAFFDQSGSMRRVVDVTTAAEATTWARKISAEINRCRMLSRVRELNRGDHKEELTETSWMKTVAGCLAVPGNQKSLTLPLHSLYAYLDTIDGAAREERYKSWTLSQALKDLQRDRVRINGVLCTPASFEDTIIALMMEISKCADKKQDDRVVGSGPTKADTPTAAEEMTALRFARQVIICSSRTNGGGDILDMLHLLFGNERFCICPDARAMQPINIHISNSTRPNNTNALSAQITMKMTYRVIPTASIGPVDNQTSENSESTSSSADSDGNLDEFEEPEQAEYKIIGTYTQTVACEFIETNDIEGSVQVEFADL